MKRPVTLLLVATLLASGAAFAKNDKERFAAGTVYLASPNYHLLIEKDGHLSLSVDPLVNFSRPAIDVLFESAALAYRDRYVIDRVLNATSASPRIIRFRDPVGRILAGNP